MTCIKKHPPGSMAVLCHMAGSNSIGCHWWSRSDEGSLKQLGGGLQSVKAETYPRLLVFALSLLQYDVYDCL